MFDDNFGIDANAFVPGAYLEPTTQNYASNVAIQQSISYQQDEQQRFLAEIDPEIFGF